MHNQLLNITNTNDIAFATTMEEDLTEAPYSDSTRIQGAGSSNPNHACISIKTMEPEEWGVSSGISTNHESLEPASSGADLPRLFLVGSTLNGTDSGSLSLSAEASPHSVAMLVLATQPPACTGKEVQAGKVSVMDCMLKMDPVSLNGVSLEQGQAVGDNTWSDSSQQVVTVPKSATVGSTGNVQNTTSQTETGLLCDCWPIFSQSYLLTDH